jgi:integrase
MRTGLRLGELIALRWREDVDLGRGRLRVQRSYHQKNGFMSTKHDKMREVPLTWDAIAALKVQRERTDGELVFTPAERTEGEALNGCTVGNALEKISEAAGMRRIRCHGPIRQVQEWLGHGSIVVTVRLRPPRSWGCVTS